MATKKSKPVILYVVITAVLVFAIAFLVFSYLPKNNQTNKIHEYKRGFYDSTLCQYKCPLSPQQIQNKTEYLPDPTCVKGCTDSFKSIAVLSDDISKNQLKEDRLIDDMSSGIAGCRTSSLDAAKTAMNTTMFLSCSIDKLEGLKSKYNYLN